MTDRIGNSDDIQHNQHRQELVCEDEKGNDNLQPLASSTPSSGKRRGRPPKKKKNNLDNDTSTGESPSTPLMGGRETNSDQPSSLSQSESKASISVTPSGKRRGRPPKKVNIKTENEIDSDEAAAVDLPLQEKDGDNSVECCATVTSSWQSDVPASGKRRGRPPKKSLDASTSSGQSTPARIQRKNANDTSTTEKSYPKRNRKSRFDTSNDSLLVCDGEEDMKGEHDDSVNKFIETSTSSDKSFSQPQNSEQVDKEKADGRKKKQNFSSEKHHDPPMKKRGTCRVSKNGVLNNSEKTDEKSKLVVKNKDQEKSKRCDISVSDHDDTLSVQKRRGRQPKSASDKVTDLSKEKKSTGTEKRVKRVRKTPAKLKDSWGGKDSDEHDEEGESECENSEHHSEDMEDEPPAKKRKRKQLKKSDEECGEIACPRCKEMLPSTKKLANHLLYRHNAIYRRDCPEGNTDGSSLRKVLKLTKRLVCQKCGKEIRFIQYYKKHEEWCGREDETFVCTICDRPFMAMYEHEHYVRHKLLDRRAKEQEELMKQMEEGKRIAEEMENEADDGQTRKRKAAKKATRILHKISADGDISDPDDDPEVKVNEEEEESEEEDGEEDEEINEEEEEWGFEPDSDEERPARNQRGGFICRVGLDKIVYMINCKQYFECQQKIDKLGAVYPDWKPSKLQWQPQDLKEYESYLPKTDTSIRFRIRCDWDKTLKESSIKRLKIFEGISEKGTHNFYVGGPVWGLAWCPMPCNLKHVQYLAISCNNDMDTCHSVSHPSTEKGVIQIWCTGNLPIQADLNAESPTCNIEVLIAHSLGAIHELTWCPHNCWDHNDSEENGKMPRLGLLAGAFSDGSVHVFSIPKPHCLEKKGEDPPVYKPDPVVSLVAYHPLKKDKTVPCLCLSWQNTNRSQFIIAGYGDGTVRVWDLRTTSKLLTLHTPPVLKLLPFRTIAAHKSSVMSVRWCPHASQFFATGGRDRVFSMWDLNNTGNFPLYNAPWTTASIEWLPYVCAVFQGMDNCYSDIEGHVRAEPYGLMEIKDENAMLSETMLTLPDCVWGLSNSNWLMMFVASNNVGKLSGGVVPRIDRVDAQRSHKRPLYLYETEIHEKDFTYEDENTEVEKDAEEIKDDKSAEGQYTSVSYECGKDKVVLEYIDHMVSARYFHTRVKNDQIQSCPFRAVYQTSFNPNLCSCSWVASAGQSGIVRLHNVRKLIIPPTKRELMDVFKKAFE